MATKFQNWGTQYGGSTLGALGDIFTGIGGKIKESKEEKQKKEREGALERMITESQFGKTQGIQPGLGSEINKSLLSFAFEKPKTQRSYTGKSEQQILEENLVEISKEAFKQKKSYQEIGEVLRQFPGYEALKQKWEKTTKRKWDPKAVLEEQAQRTPLE